VSVQEILSYLLTKLIPAIAVHISSEQAMANPVPAENPHVTATSESRAELDPSAAKQDVVEEPKSAEPHKPIQSEHMQGVESTKSVQPTTTHATTEVPPSTSQEPSSTPAIADPPVQTPADLSNAASAPAVDSVPDPDEDELDDLDGTYSLDPVLTMY
jgi:hypothetical protein